MKLTPRLFAALALLITAGPVALAAGPTPAARKEKEETELTQKMDKMNAAYRQLRRQAGDATKNTESLKLAATMREIATAAARLEPFKLTEIPAADRAKMLAGYRAKIKELGQAIARLEAALKAGHNEEAAQLVEALKALQKEGHKEYKSKSID